MSSRNYKQAPYFEVRYGNCNFAAGMTKINAWVLTEEVREFPSKALTKCRAGASETADTEGFGDFGRWHVDYLEAVTGTILFITAERTVRRVPQAGAGVILRLREGAPSYQISVRVTADPKARYATLPVFVGRADLIEYDQANEEHGIELNRNQVSNWLDDEDEYHEVFDIVELAPARTGQPEIMEVTTDAGVQRVTVDPPRTRRIKVRR